MQLIAAIATPQGRGGVAVVRVSGEGAWELAQKITKRERFEPNHMYPGPLDCGDFTDYGLCVCFRAPKSFTGEDVAEFHCHGGTEIARGLLARILSLGARPAERGEFTRRAYLNGKLSLSAVEGLGEMIDAQSQAQVRAGYTLYTEALTEEGKRLQASLTRCLASIDADVDYPEEDLTAQSRPQIEGELIGVQSALLALKGRYRTGKKIKEGVRTVICGKPNAGKSTLFNTLLGYDRTIVSTLPGTTRDIVEESIEIGGVLFRLIDTAGLHEGADEVEAEGIRRAKRALESADVVIALREADEEVALPEGVPVINVHGKCDLIQDDFGSDVSVSSVTGEGIEALKRLLFERGYGAETDGVFLLEERQYRAVCDALECTERALSAVRQHFPAELYAQDIKEAWDALGRITGETATEAVIAEIFEKFCVGK